MTVAEGIEIVFIPSLSERITFLYSIRMKCTLLVPGYVLEHCSIRHRNPRLDITPFVLKAKPHPYFTRSLGYRLLDAIFF